MVHNAIQLFLLQSAVHYTLCLDCLNLPIPKNNKPIYVFNSNTYNLAKKKQLTFYLTVKKQIVNNVYTDTYATCIA